MRRELVLTPKFERAYRRFVRRDRRPQEQIDETLRQMELRMSLLPFWERTS